MTRASAYNPEHALDEPRALLPRYAANFIAAAGRTGARLVVRDNVHCLGHPRDGLVSADAPLAAVSRKGAIRAGVTQTVLRAHAAGPPRR